MDAIIACTTWWKSHNYSMWMISALIRLNIREFIEIIKDEEGDVDSELMLQVKSTVDSLKGNKRLSEEEVRKFLVEQKLLKDLFLQKKDKYSQFVQNGYQNDDQFALFFNVIEDYQVYLSVYIAIRTSD